MMDYENAKLIAEQTDGKLTADDVINLMTYGTTNAQDMAPNEPTKGLELTYSDMTSGY